MKKKIHPSLRMLVEVFLTLCVLFSISVWFYSQRRESIEILQVEFSNSLLTLHELLQESQPIILRGCPFPQILTKTKLSEVPRLNNFPLRAGSSTTLETYRTQTANTFPDDQAVGNPLLDNTLSRTLAKELAIDTWINHTYSEFITELSGYFSVFKSSRVSVLLGGHGMVRPTSLYTCILVTEGTYTVSLVNKRSEQFLPAAWTYRYPPSLSVNDTPLVGEIQFIDIILRAGTMIIIPCHVIYSVSPKSINEFHAATLIELDSPISNLAHLF
jgi:hypothetical protein